MAEQKRNRKPRGGEDKVKAIHITQQCEPDFWDWATKASERSTSGGVVIDNRMGLTLDAARDLVARGTAAELGEYLVQRLEHVGDMFCSSDPKAQEQHPGCKVLAAYAIIHDRDTVSVWNEAKGCKEECLKARHIHLLVIFEGTKRADYASGPLGYLAKRLGVETQYLEKPKRGGNSVRIEAFGGNVSQSVDNQLAYLCHVKYPEKFQYNPDDVATLRGPDYGAIYRERLADWKKGRAFVKQKRAAMELEPLREAILNGEYTKQQIMLTDELFEVYARNQVACDNAFEAFGQRRAYQAAAKLRNNDFSTYVLFVHGASGIGKTQIAQSFIAEAMRQAAERGERWRQYRAATGNPLDDWRGEEVILLDDLRASAMDANDWLLLLDPFNASPARARYQNKGEVAPRLIVITATIEPVEFFFYARKKGEVSEALDQFIRRLASIVHVYRAEGEDDPRYLVQRTGQVEPYKRQIDTMGFRGELERNVIPLNYGVSSSHEHSARGAVSTLMLDLAKSSPDVGFEDGDGWLADAARVVAERQQLMQLASIADVREPVQAGTELSALDQQ